MSTPHAEIGPELRQLAQALMDRIDPAVRAAAAAATNKDSPGRCQQVWCPVCALAAVASGEQHPLLDVVAEHSIALLAVLRALVDDLEPPTSDGGDDANADDTDADMSAGYRPPPGRYQRIAIKVEE